MRILKTILCQEKINFQQTCSTFTPHAGRNEYLDFYINIVTEKILQSERNRKYFSDITKPELETLRATISG